MLQTGMQLVQKLLVRHRRMRTQLGLQRLLRSRKPAGDGETPPPIF
jgi:hypothetical protein